jgi:2-oxoglutarate ferredoxin oxidoreductase subunit beta
LGDGYDPADRIGAFQKAQEWGDRIPIGVVYQKERPTFEENLEAIKKGPLVKQKLDTDICNKLLDEFL